MPDLPLVFTKSLIEGHGKTISVNKNNLNYSIYDHSYNASPYSLKENIDNFLNLPDSKKNNILIIGSMKELGRYSNKYHLEVIDKLKAIKNCFFIGEEFFTLLNNSHNFNSYLYSLDLLPVVKKYLKQTDRIFIMGSRDNRLDIIVRELC